MNPFSPTEVKSLTPIGKTVLVSDMAFDERTTLNGVIIVNDNMKSSGIRPRWGKIYAVGPEQDDPEMKVGRWVLVEHGRWSRGINIKDPTGEKTIRKIDVNSLLMISDEPVHDMTMSDKVL